MPELILAIDVGTTSLGAGLFSADGQLAGWASVGLRSVSPAPGLVEQDAGLIWRAARRAVSRALVGVGRAPGDLAAIGVTTQRTSALVWDRRTGQPLTPLVVWSDLRGAERARQLREAGFMLVPQQAAAKLEAMLAPFGDRPHLAWGNIDTFLIWKLSGGAVHATDRSQAWPTGYLNPMTMGWNEALLAHQGIHERLFPNLVDTWGPIGVTARSAFGAEVPITADVADQQAALIAHGGQAGAAKVTYGTSATLDLSTGSDFVYKSPSAPPFILSSVGGETRFCIEGMVYSAGSALEWLRTSFRMGDHKRFEALAASVPDAGGGWFLPALQGLGAPYADPDRRGALGGLTSAVTRGHIARAALEGVAFRVREVLEHIYGLTDLPPPEALGVDGGMARSDRFLQIQADLLGRPIRRHAIAEATACGAAICAGLGAGLLTPADARAFIRYERTLEPGIAANENLARFEAWKAAVYG
jgi:glycerol kinase